MAVYSTEALFNRFQAAGLDFDLFVEEFEHWKVGWPSNEYEFELFGKDGAYEQPRAYGERVLRHVHLQPVSSGTARKRWNWIWRRRGRKTSDRALVYAENHAGDFLLLTILDEPDAHEIAKMKTRADRDLMEALAKV